MAKVKLTVTESRCRDKTCKTGDEFYVEGLCPPLCHELWSAIYPQVFALLNGADLDRGSGRAACFDAACPDGGRVRIHGERIDYDSARRIQMSSATTRSKIAGCLIAGGLGDALGYEVEFSSWPAIQARFGRDGIRELALHDGKARISDDTQMTLFTAEGLALGYDRVNERGIGADYEVYIHLAYLCWLRTQGYPVDSLWVPVSRLLKNPDMHQLRAPGNTCLNALRSGKMGTFDKPLNHSKGCGGVMRTAPCGLVRCHTRGKPFGDPLMLGAKAAAITHSHPMGWVPAGMLSDIVDRCLYENYASLRELIEASLAETLKTFASCEGIDAFEAMMRRAIELSAKPHGAGIETASVDEPAIRSLGGGWVGDEALAIAVYAALRYDSDLKDALIAAVNHGGDSDSTGAICGNILGAWLGLEAIDPAWVRKLELVDEMEYLADALQRIGDNG